VPAGESADERLARVARRLAQRVTPDLDLEAVLILHDREGTGIRVPARIVVRGDAKAGTPQIECEGVLLVAVGTAPHERGVDGGDVEVRLS
jgi:hypothetical protein